ncbi:thiol peroxidase [Piscirickettsia litoralis]|uniref:Thioredoxin domain-containing protein n=1 Tax=Piscirickettsia litoralis TaxID=1891921 RepID=A0ABX3A5R7_9GAMM|nr:thiol peroxidase [Piscirickettsia litoralis]ODN41459.1 hypothetical protein BGC07_15160 [Piscirickettsia litoralis]
MKKPVQVAGHALEVGQQAPMVKLINPELKPIQLGGDQDKVQVIATVVSLNTPVCDAEAIRLNKIAQRYPEVQVTIVSKDLPFEDAKFKKQNRLNSVEFASDYRSNDFGKLYGTSIESSVLQGLDSRTIYVIDKNGKVSYREVVEEISTPPSYQALEQAIQHTI